ncbi:hypothetical protein DBV39_09575 [Orrella marina]|uniref:Uncharacterized protein n=1 Tax=Orrella marina TaxID=2163011 RepID=A0A2R4XJH0_9BURK|nr:hypothetical protein DBV39_09575 [Orrella marina]
MIRLTLDEHIHEAEGRVKELMQFKRHLIQVGVWRGGWKSHGENRHRIALEFLNYVLRCRSAAAE